MRDIRSNKKIHLRWLYKAISPNRLKLIRSVLMAAYPKLKTTYVQKTFTVYHVERL